jgi:hypothetical protein
MVSQARGRPGSPWTRWVAARRLRGWPVDAWSGFLGGVLASLLILALLTWKAEWVADLTLGANPTCASPRGLREVDIVKAEAGSTQSKTEDGERPPRVSFDRKVDYVAEAAVDDASNTVWIPEIVNDYPWESTDDSSEESSTRRTEISREPRFLTEGDANRLTLTLDDSADVRLVCVVNGAALWYISYQNWGRVRSVEVWGDDGRKTRGILQSLGSEDFPNAQVAGRNLGDTRTIRLELIDAYAGIRVENYNARACLDGATLTSEAGSDQEPLDWFLAQRKVKLAGGVLSMWPGGCILEPKVKAGIADVRVYATD